MSGARNVRRQYLLRGHRSLALSVMAGSFGTAVSFAKARICVNNKHSAPLDDEDEPREYSWPAWYLHECESYHRVDSASRIIHAAPDKIYRAHMDPHALVSWLPPEGMTGRIEQFEPRVGGTYRMVLTYGQPS